MSIQRKFSVLAAPKGGWGGAPGGKRRSMGFLLETCTPTRLPLLSHVPSYGVAPQVLMLGGGGVCDAGSV